MTRILVPAGARRVSYAVWLGIALSAVLMVSSARARTPPPTLTGETFLVAGADDFPCTHTGPFSLTISGTATGPYPGYGCQDPADGRTHRLRFRHVTVRRVSSSPRAAALTSTINRVMRQASIPGAIVGVWQRGADPYVKAFGVRDRVTRRPMSTDLYMRIGSETKTFTVTALLGLVDQGKVRLDDPISKYVAGVPDGDAITLRELAEMRSGLFDYVSNAAFLRAWFSHLQREWTPRQLLAYSLSRPLVFVPGTRYDYVNANTVLLGLVVQKVSHQPVAVYIERHILEPLRLTHTSLPAGAAFPSPHAQGYTTRSPECVLRDRRCNTLIKATSWNSSWGWAAGAMVSTLGDLRRWAGAVATGQLLSRVTQKQRLRFLPTGTRNFGYGLGLMNFAGWIGHSGLLPGYQSLTTYLPSEQATIVVLINTGPGPRHQPVFLLGHAITKLITPRHVIITG